MNTPSISPMPLDLPPGAGVAFDAPALARRVLREARVAALATNDPASGFPLATLTTVATDPGGAPLLLLSGLSLHTRNLAADGRASLLLADIGKGDPLAHPRLTLVGTFAVVDDAGARRRFLAKHPKAALYVDLPDFRFFRMTVSAVHLNGGFARAAALGPADVATETAGAEALLAAEESAIAHMNEDHADAVALYATAIAKRPAGRWIVTGIDPEGMDVSLGDMTARIPFPMRVATPGALAGVLKEMAAAARAAQA